MADALRDALQAMIGLPPALDSAATLVPPKQQGPASGGQVHSAKVDSGAGEVGAPIPVADMERGEAAKPAAETSLEAPTLERKDGEQSRLIGGMPAQRSESTGNHSVAPAVPATGRPKKKRRAMSCGGRFCLDDGTTERHPAETCPRFQKKESANG